MLRTLCHAGELEFLVLWSCRRYFDFEAISLAFLVNGFVATVLCGEEVVQFWCADGQINYFVIAFIRVNVVYAHARRDWDTVRYLPDNSVNVIGGKKTTAFFFEVHNVVPRDLVLCSVVRGFFARYYVALSDIYLTLESFALHCVSLECEFLLGI